MIQNAKDVRLNANSGTVPDMGSALTDWFQPMVFTRIAKTVKGFVSQEKPSNVNFLGVWQPLTERQLRMKPEGQRSWKWFMVHAAPDLQLKPDEIIEYLGVRYRVMAQWDWSLYNYMEYHLVDDFTGSGP